MSTPQEHESAKAETYYWQGLWRQAGNSVIGLQADVDALEAEVAHLLRVNGRLRAELAATGRAAQALASYGPVDMCHNGHPFEPGRNEECPDDLYGDPRWCNACGEPRRAA